MQTSTQTGYNELYEKAIALYNEMPYGFFQYNYVMFLKPVTDIPKVGCPDGAILTLEEWAFVQSALDYNEISFVDIQKNRATTAKASVEKVPDILVNKEN